MFCVQGFPTFLANKCSHMMAGSIIPFMTINDRPSLHMNTVLISIEDSSRLILRPVTVVPGCSIRPDPVAVVPRVSLTSQPGKASMEFHHELMFLIRVNGGQVSLLFNMRYYMPEMVLFIIPNLFIHTLILCIIPSFLLRKVLVTFPVK